ncbi:MAG TPA: 2TM domain-containing protein [Candidatus Thermoplasmatota archaeon]|nr:2TM domain-containing protein [Candidatus Thermoplasmatota archaeon]
MDGPTDAEIREMAEARVAFKGSAVSYLLINPFLIGVWWFTDPGGYYWPIWVHLGWGIGLGFQAWKTYGTGGSVVSKEEQRLRAKYGRL